MIEALYTIKNKVKQKEKNNKINEKEVIIKNLS